jgi:hypothetical protein
MHIKDILMIDVNENGLFELFTLQIETWRTNNNTNSYKVDI